MKSSKNNTELREKTKKFVTEVVTELYKQRPNTKIINATTEKVLAGIPQHTSMGAIAAAAQSTHRVCLKDA